MLGDIPTLKHRDQTSSLDRFRALFGRHRCKRFNGVLNPTGFVSVNRQVAVKEFVGYQRANGRAALFDGPELTSVGFPADAIKAADPGTLSVGVAVVLLALGRPHGHDGGIRHPPS